MTKEIRQILAAYSKIDFAVQKAALATVVHVDGSSYRRPGARMLITDDGNLTGAISGGCLEGDALRKARLVMHNSDAMVVTYDTMDDDDAKLGIGLGCNGVIHILIEPLYPGRPGNPVELLKRIHSYRKPFVLVTLFSLTDKRAAPPGTCCLYSLQGELFSSLVPGLLRDAVTKDIAEAFRQDHSLLANYEEITGFIELVKPAISLVILGGGNDVVPLTEIAHVLGWESTVIDGRPTHARAERFPKATEVWTARPERVLEKVVPDEQTYFLLMTHNYNYDLAALKQLVLRQVTYVGVLGPKKKMERMIGELRQEDGFNDESFHAVYGPVGLDIGAEAAEEIALAIVAEIKSVAASRKGGPLRDLDGTIHNHFPLLSN